MANKVEWHGEIPTDVKWLTFADQSDKGYEYNKYFTEITASTDDNGGSITDEIKFNVKKNSTLHNRTAKVHFRQKGGKRAIYKVTQAVGHIKIQTNEKTRFKEYIDKQIVISPTATSCTFQETATTFTATFSYKEVNDKYQIGYYADTKEPYEDFVESITSKTKSVTDVTKFDWSSDNGSRIKDGNLTFNKNTDRVNPKTYNVLVTYSGVSATAVVTQGRDDSFVEYIVRTNLKGATATFTENGETLAASVVTDSGDGSANPYIAKCTAHPNINLSVMITGDVNEVKTYSISVLPDKWDIKNNTTIDVTVTSKYHSVKNDFSKNSAIYENNTFDKTITIGTKETDGDAEYSAKLPSGITDSSASKNFTKLTAQEGLFRQGGSIEYYIVESPTHKDFISLSNTSDEVFIKDKVLTLVYDYGILDKTLENLSSLRLYRTDRASPSFNENNIKAIYIATNNITDASKDNFNVIEVSYNDPEYFRTDGYFKTLDISKHKDLIVKGNKVVVFIELNTDTIPNEMEYYNNHITAVRVPTPYIEMDNACLYCNENLRTVFLGKTITKLVSDCLAGFSNINKIFIGSDKAPALDPADDTGYTFRATQSGGYVQGKNCTIYGVKGSSSSYHVNSTDPWQWDGCIKADITPSDINNNNEKIPEMNENIKTWKIDTNTYESDKELETFKEEVINKITGSPII